MRRTAIQLYIFFSILVIIWNTGIIAAPILKHSGFNATADAIYEFYSRICHQDDARSFHIAGEKFGVCIRCTSIYLAAILSIFFIPLSGALNKSFPSGRNIFLAALFPMVADVVFNDLNIHSSNTATRIVTGAFFGAAALWWLMPLIIEAGSELIEKRKNRSLNPGEYHHAGKAQ
jgi:uncharacterized membrane protein